MHYTRLVNMMNNYLKESKGGVCCPPAIKSVLGFRHRDRELLALVWDIVNCHDNYEKEGYDVLTMDQALWYISTIIKDCNDNVNTSEFLKGFIQAVLEKRGEVVEFEKARNLYEETIKDKGLIKIETARIKTCEFIEHFRIKEK